MRSDLLLEIADMLDNLTPEERAHFNMGNWCGTTACAIGWACVKLESVRKAGLAIYHYRTVDVARRLVAMGDTNPLPIDQAVLDVTVHGSPYTLVGRKLLESYKAIDHVLDIVRLKGLSRWGDEQFPYPFEMVPLSDALFGHNAYQEYKIPPETVSKRIREAVAHYDPTYAPPVQSFRSSVDQSSTTSASTTSPSES